jgi:hypothetical protein
MPSRRRRAVCTALVVVMTQRARVTSAQGRRSDSAGDCRKTKGVRVVRELSQEPDVHSTLRTAQRDQPRLDGPRDWLAVTGWLFASLHAARRMKRRGGALEQIPHPVLSFPAGRLGHTPPNKKLPARYFLPSIRLAGSRCQSGAVDGVGWGWVWWAAKTGVAEAQRRDSRPRQSVHGSPHDRRAGLGGCKTPIRFGRAAQRRQIRASRKGDQLTNLSTTRCCGQSQRTITARVFRHTCEHLLCLLYN